MLRSGDNLIDEIKLFLDNKENVILFCAYIKLEELKKINSSKKIESIVVRWEFNDLCNGASDLEIFEYCEENKIRLYRNDRIHLKAFWDKKDSVLFGSANISSRGLGFANNYNFELNGIQNKLDIRDIVYLEKIFRSSRLITNDLYLDLKKKMNNYELVQETYHDESIIIASDPFLLSELPMSQSVDWFIAAYYDLEQLTPDEIKYLAHDMALYDIGFGLDEKALLAKLSESVNEHRFIVALKETIKKSKNRSLHYGGVVAWIQNNTTTVPTPRRWEIKEEQIVNILYDWICFFDKYFIHHRPNYSQIIEYTGN